MMALLVLGVSVEASAKEKKLKPWKKQECRWLEPLKKSMETCEGRAYRRGQIQCAAYVVTGYCEAKVLRDGTTLSDDANQCLREDSGRTKSCFKKTRAFSDRLKEQGKKTRSVTKFPTCVWATDSFLPANDIYVSDLTTEVSHVPHDCLEQQFVYRRASCQIDGQTHNPMLFCRVSDASTDARACMGDEKDKLVTSCREILEPILASKQRDIQRGQSQGATQ